MSNELTLTNAQQSAAIDNIHKSMALRSGAGCGKTFVLARRFTELLRNYQGQDSPLSHYVALTFTEKAAMEMAQRVRKMLLEFCQQADEEEKRKILSWLEELPEARISTIHSFCANLLRSNAIEAGLDPNFAVCGDEFLVGQLRHDAANQAMLEAVRQSDASALFLLQRFSISAMLDMLAKLLDNREWWTVEKYGNEDDIWEHWLELWDNNRIDAWKRLEQDSQIDKAINRLMQEVCSVEKDSLLAFRAKFVALLDEVRSNPARRTAEWFDELAVSPGRLGGDKAWGGKGSSKQVRDKIKAVQELLKPYALHAQDLGDDDRDCARAIASLVSLAHQANLRYQAEKRQRGILDFNDLMLATHRLLEDQPALRSRLAKQIHQMLVDECQDTDAFQLSMLKQILNGDGDSESAAFLVGDGKQSIYRFRGADVNVFDDLCHTLGQGRTETLDLSFRTHEAGIAFVNHVFQRMMTDGYEPIEANRKTCPAQPSVEILLAEDSTPISSASQAVKAQAQVTADRIAEMLQKQEKIVWDETNKEYRSVAPGDIAILFSRMTNSLAYERELQKRDIPYYVVGGTGFFQQQEVFDILNTLRVIDNPMDDISLMGVLRSSLIALDDNALMHIAEACDQPPYFQFLQQADLSTSLTCEQIETLQLAMSMLQRLAACKDSIGTAEIIEDVLSTTAYEATLLSQFQGKRMLGNVRQLIDYARNADSEGVSLAEFIAQMDSLVLSESRFEQAVVASESDNVVRLMTVHKSKGLEFPVVFVPDLNGGRTAMTSTLLYNRQWGLTLKNRPALDTIADQEKAPEPLTFQAAKQQEQRELQAEEIRRLYVAITRHEDHLILVGANQRTKDGLFESSGSYLRQLDEILAIGDTIDSQNESITYAGGRFKAIVRCVKSEGKGLVKRKKSLGQTIVEAAQSAGDIAQGLLADRRSNATLPPLAGPIPASVGNIQVAVTALGDFAHCPMLYRWRYELRAPDLPRSQNHGTTQAQSIDAATTGTFLHRCMELLDFSAPQKPRVLVEEVLAEMNLQDQADPAALAEQFSQMLTTFQTRPLWQDLCDARQVFRELDFVLSVDHLTLRGQIDLLYEDSKGHWHVVDYKSDRVTGSEDVAQHALRYQLQMQAYCLAAQNYLQKPVDSATLYFLRPGSEYEFEMSATLLQQEQTRLSSLAQEMISARRSGDFVRRSSPACRHCTYSPLCQRVAVNGNCLSASDSL